MSHSTSHSVSQAAPATPPPSIAWMAAGLVVAIALYWLVSRLTRRRVSRQRLNASQVGKARKRYVAAIDKRLKSDKLDQYSVLLDTRNLVNGYYEQKGQVVGVRFTVKQAHCRRCKVLDGQEFSLLDPVRLAAHTPPMHGEVRRGVHCVATLVAIRAEEGSEKRAPARK